jgi:hypothetical protein
LYSFLFGTFWQNEAKMLNLFNDRQIATTNTLAVMIRLKMHTLTRAPA